MDFENVRDYQQNKCCWGTKQYRVYTVRQKKKKIWVSFQPLRDTNCENKCKTMLTIRHF